MTRQQAIYYLSGMIDGEGHIGYKEYMRPRPGAPGFQSPVKSRQLVIYSCDEDLILACIDCLEILDVEWHYYVTQRKQPGWNAQHEVRVTARPGFEKLNRVLKLKSTKKREELQRIVDSYGVSVQN